MLVTGPASRRVAWGLVACQWSTSLFWLSPPWTAQIQSMATEYYPPGLFFCAVAGPLLTVCFAHSRLVQHRRALAFSVLSLLFSRMSALPILDQEPQAPFATFRTARACMAHWYHKGGNYSDCCARIANIKKADAVAR